MTDYLSDTFGERGYLSRQNPKYRPREGQIALARATHETFEKGIPSLQEGPCGTGKSIGYSVPASYFASTTKKKVVIATATNALLEQLVRGDLPLIQRAVPWSFTFAALKGRSNYLCIDKLENYSPRPEAFMRRDAAKRLLPWAKTTKTGNKDEAPPEGLRAWVDFSVTPEECKKPACRVKEFCYAEKARAKATDADIVVTNHHMLALHIANGGRALPDFEYLIIDEAHEFPDTLREYMGGSISLSTFRKIVDALDEMSIGDRDLMQIAEELFNQVSQNTAHPLDQMLGLPPSEDDDKGRHRVRGELCTDKMLMARLDQALKDISARIDELAERSSTRPPEAYAAERLIQRVRRVLWPGEIACVRWTETDARGRMSLYSQPVEVGPTMNAAIFRGKPKTVVTSATLTTGGTFGFVRREMGVPKTVPAIEVPSPFRFDEQAMLILPELPEPDRQEDAWFQGVLETLLTTVRTLDGRTMGLFTSIERARRAARWLTEKEGQKRTILAQGDMESRALTDAFKKDERSVLIGTSTFWTGIDAPGDTLTALVIDRLPMLMESPALEAMRESLGKDFFGTYYAPKSALMLRQGVGRLVRSITDVGVVVLCDRRITTRSYGTFFLASLPNMSRSKRLEDMVPFLLDAKQTVRKRAA